MGANGIDRVNGVKEGIPRVLATSLIRPWEKNILHIQDTHWLH